MLRAALVHLRPDHRNEVVLSQRLRSRYFSAKGRAYDRGVELNIRKFLGNGFGLCLAERS